MAFASTLKQCVSHAVWANKEGSERERQFQGRIMACCGISR